MPNPRSITLLPLSRRTHPSNNSRVSPAKVRISACLTFGRATREHGSRVLPGQDALRVNSLRNVASLSAKNEPKQLKTGLKWRFNSLTAQHSTPEIAKRDLLTVD